ncbi:hypothetical protein ICE98_01520 [Lactococcus lactis]|nr:hypothetical protein [Lactococcus lactis]
MLAFLSLEIISSAVISSSPSLAVFFGVVGLAFALAFAFSSSTFALCAALSREVTLFHSVVFVYHKTAYDNRGACHKNFSDFGSAATNIGAARGKYANIVKMYLTVCVHCKLWRIRCERHFVKKGIKFCVRVKLSVDCDTIITYKRFWAGFGTMDIDG